MTIITPSKHLHRDGHEDEHSWCMPHYWQWMPLAQHSFNKLSCEEIYDCPLCLIRYIAIPFDELFTLTISSTTYPINRRTVDIRMMVNVMDITILRSISWDGDKEAIKVTSWHPMADDGNRCFMTDLKSDKNKCTSSTTQWSFWRWLNVCVATPLLKECEDDTHIPKMGTWESSGTLKTSKLDCRGQNTSH